MNYFATKRSIIHPEDQKDMAYWTRKWGVDVRQINDAILETGSLRLEDIKNVLRRKGAFGSLSLFLHKLFHGSVTIH